jgi:glutathione S-transferase
MKLYIGNKNYSSWSLRGWLAVKISGAPFEEIAVELSGASPNRALRNVSPSARVPALYDGDIVVWDSLAIAEYLAERHRGIWPEDGIARAWARSVSAEMHSGFSSLREQMAMNVRLRAAKAPSPAAAADIARILALWAEGRERFGPGGTFLCGDFCAVDAFWCPVAFRFQSYGVPLVGIAAAYARALLDLPAMAEWAADAERETERIAAIDLAQAQTQTQQ